MHTLGLHGVIMATVIEISAKATSVSKERFETRPALCKLKQHHRGDSSNFIITEK